MTEPQVTERWLGLLGNLLGSVGAVTALLFYFGYASTRAKYEYFGVDVDVIGLDTQDILIRSSQPLLTPVVVLAVLALLGVWLHWAVSGILDTETSDSAGHWVGAGLLRRVAAVGMTLGAGMLTVGVVLVLVYVWLRDWWAYDIVTPMCFLAGVLLLTYSAHVKDRGLVPGRRHVGSVMSRRSAWVLCGVVVAGSVFWAASTVADWSGRGQAVTLAGRFRELPGVILDTRERLYLRDPVIAETALPIEDGQTFRYRYRSLRLLVEGSGRLFLVPEVWTPSGTTLVVPMDGSVRAQFQFRNPM